MDLVAWRRKKCAYYGQTTNLYRNSPSSSPDQTSNPQNLLSYLVNQ
ncbi:hypothetical protein C789_4603 [Microcystis aeruginosa FACHB-905 = DIANCHI905]|nr:hypothetical protein C789_4603 [Microcystis aeruginosa FACHB-905 = DIANCHI905]